MKTSLLKISLLALFLSGCGESDDVLIMGTNALFPPFEYVGGPSGNEYMGLDIDIAKQIASDSGKTLKIENMKFDSLIMALNAGKIDFIASGMTITPERQASVDFSTPYYEATQVVITHKSDTSINSVADLQGKNIAVQLGATGDIMAQKYTNNVAAFNSGFEAIMELKNNKVDLVLFDSQPAANFMQQNPNLKIQSLQFEAEFYGLAVSKQNPQLLKQINTSLANMQADGQYDALITKYMK